MAFVGRHVSDAVPSLNSSSSLRLSEDLQKRMIEAQVRTAKGKLRNEIKESVGAYSVEDCLSYIREVVQVDCELLLKYEVIPVKRILTESCQKGSLKRLNEALGILEKYGKNLLRPSPNRPPMWRSVMFANGVFSEKVDWMEGGREILRHYGYKVDIADGVAFPDDQEPDPNKVAMVTSDILVAREEIQLYIEGRHPRPEPFEKYLPMNARVLQNLPHNAYDSICETYIPESLPPAVNNQLPKHESKMPPVLPVQQSPHTNHRSPFTGPVIETPPPATTVLKPPLNELPSSGGMKDCDICGHENILLICELCDSKILCKDCDEQWHKHPKRSHHQRKMTGANRDTANVKPHRNNSQTLRETEADYPASGGSTASSADAIEHSTTKSETIRVIPGKKTLRSQLPNLSIFDTNSSSNNSEEITSGCNNRRSIDIQKEMAFHGITMTKFEAEKKELQNVSQSKIPNMSVFERTLTNSSTNKTGQHHFNLRKEIQDHGIQLVTNQSGQVGSIVKSLRASSVTPQIQPRLAIQDVLNIPNFEQKRIKLEALVISTTTEMKQIEENLQLIIMHQSNFLDNELYKEFIQKKEHLLRDLQIYESYRKMFEEEEKVRRLIQQSQDDALFRKSIRLPPGDSYIPPTTRASLKLKQGNDRLSSLAPSMFGSTLDPSYFEVPHSLPNTRPQQVHELSPWHIATNILGVNAEYKGACPKCGKITNYYNDVCHHCKEEIPINIKQEVLPSPSPATPGKQAINLEGSSFPSGLKGQNVSPTAELGMGARPKINKEAVLSPIGVAVPTTKANTETRKVLPKHTSPSSKFGVHPKKWMCQHCTFENEAMTRVCLICDRTSDKPQYVEDIHSNVTDDDKLNSGDWDSNTERKDSPAAPRNVAVNFQEDAEKMAIEKQKAREEFKRMMEEEERKKAGTIRNAHDEELPGRSTDGPEPTKTVGVDDVDAGFSTTDLEGKNVSDTCGPSQKQDLNDLDVFQKEVTKEDKFTLQKKLEDIAVKKQQEELVMLSRETVRLIRMAENQGFTFDELDLSIKQNNDMDPLAWLQETWQELIGRFISIAPQLAEEPIFGEVSDSEARRALVEKNGDVDSAVRQCVNQRKEKIQDLCKITDCSAELANEALRNTNGDIDEALEFIAQKHLKDVSQRLWEDKSVTSSTTSSVSSLQIQISSSSSSRYYRYGNIDPTVEAVIMDRDAPFERRARMVLVEGKMQGWGRAENVLKVLDLLPPDQEVTIKDVIDAVSDCGNVNDSIQHLLQDCEICYCTSPISKMISLPLCQCKICIDCLKSYFEVQVKEKHARDMVCPVCEQPDIQDEIQAETHFTYISVLLRSLISQTLTDLFLEKLRDWRLMQDPNFRWCSHCECGFIFNNEEGQLRMKCPDCNKETCFECKKPWERQHDGLNCQEFAVWKQMNDPEHQAAGLAKHLAENGIDCPECKFRYALAKGGCMHFKCSQCRHEFCSGCYKPFKRGENCQLLRSCAKAGLHCHHPRDCLFYLRDFDVERLQKLLKDNQVNFDTKNETDDGAAARDEIRCPVMEQKELPNGYKDEACGKDVPENYAGLCQLHYKEYLVSLINKHNIDPLVIMDTDELKIQCTRSEKDVINKRRKESTEQYRKRLIQFIQREIELPRRNIDAGTPI